ncbi:MAG TPA: NHL repeat-containing protein [Polyangiaceae bacterium]|nr:NHL repeat-containing protein [Polyangiaceae bacterium]
MTTALGFSGLTLLVVFATSGCSGGDLTGDSAGDPASELDGTVTEALRSVDAGDSILVAVADGAILRFSTAGASKGTFAQGPSNPSGMALDRFQNVYVASLADNTVRRFSPSGQDLGVFASAGLSQPVALTFDPSGNLYVANNGDNSIAKFSAAGKALGTIVSLLGEGCVYGMVFERWGDLLVADPCYNIVRKFSATGRELGVFASAGLSTPLTLLLKPNGNLLVACSDDAGAFRNTIREFTSTGRDLGTFTATGLNFPSDLAFDARGNLLVTNEQQRPGALDYAIQKVAADGTDLGEFALLSSQPRALVVMSSSRCGEHAKRSHSRRCGPGTARSLLGPSFPVQE